MTALLPCPWGCVPKRDEYDLGRVFCQHVLSMSEDAWNTRPSADLTDEEKEALKFADFMWDRGFKVDAKNDALMVLRACVRRLSGQSKEVTP